MLHVALGLGTIRYARNDKARRILGWVPRTNEETILATAEWREQIEATRLDAARGPDGAPLADVTAVRGTPCAFAPGVAGHTAPLPQAGRGEPRCRRGTFYLCDIRVRDVARRAG